MGKNILISKRIIGSKMRSVVGKYGLTYYYGKDEYVGRSVHNYGEFSPIECTKIVSLCSEMSGVVLDIGANIGCISQAVHAAGYEVIGFEPQPAIYDLFVKNNPSVSCHLVALGSEPGFAKMPRVDYSRKGNFGGLGVGYRSELGSITVPMRTLDSYEFLRTGLIKIDVEGHELEVLKGGYNTIMSLRPIMYIEDDRDDKSKALHKYLEEVLEYDIEPHEPPLFSPDNYFGNKNNIWSPHNFVSKNIICRPC